jgi:hypothetical protein
VTAWGSIASSRPRKRRTGSRLHRVLAGPVLASSLLFLVFPEVASAAPQPLNLNLSGENAVGRITTPGLSCAEGGQGAYRHYSTEATLPSGVMSKLEGDFRSSLDVHYEESPFGFYGSGQGPPRAFLLGTESHATLSNQRGAVQVRLASGTCAKPTLNFDGETVTGSGTWSILSTGGSGAYRQATGDGTFRLTSGIAPGADNPWVFGLSGSLSVLQPSLKAEVSRTYWGNLGVDYITRTLTVEYKVTNTGPGDSYAVRLVSTASTTPGVTPLGPHNQPLGDLLQNQFDFFTVRYKLGLLQPCALVILGCKFSTTLTVDMPDALDVSSIKTANVDVTAPNLPPPL